MTALSIATIFITMLREPDNWQEDWQTTVMRYDFKMSFQERHRRNKPKILVWTPFFGSMSWYENAKSDIASAPKCDCMLTDDKNEVQAADAVVFHLSDITWTAGLLNGLQFKFPSYRRSDQVWVLYNQEPITMVLGSFGAWQGLFNWTWSYRRDSDVYTPYGEYRKLTGGEMVKTDSESCKMKTQRHDYFSDKINVGGVAVISNCVDDARRYRLIEKLRKFINIEVYGKCGSPCQNDSVSCDNLRASFQFYLALENSDCRDYVTEKYWFALNRNQIPVVAWKFPMDNIVIPNSYINLYDFKSLDTAGDFIKRVSENRTLYNSYFRWKSVYEQTFTPGFCVLCERLRDSNKLAQVYNDMNGWLTSSLCDPITVSMLLDTIVYLLIDVDGAILRPLQQN